MEIINFNTAPQDIPICVTWCDRKNFELDDLPDADELEYNELLMLKVNLESEISFLNDHEPRSETSEAHENWEDAHEELEDLLDDVLDRLEELGGEN